MNIRSIVAKRMQPADVDAGFLAGLAQGGGHRTVVGGIGGAAGECRLAGVVAQGRRPHGDQQVGVVGEAAVGRAGSRAGEQHQDSGFAAGAAQGGDRRRGLAGDHRQHVGRQPAPGRVGNVIDVVDQRTQPGRAGVRRQRNGPARGGGVPIPQGRTPSTHGPSSRFNFSAYPLSVPIAAAISSAVLKARGSVWATLPSGRRTTVAGITFTTRSAAATRRRPSCRVGSRTPSSASRSKRGRLVLVLMHRHHHYVRTDPSLILGHRGQFGGARRAPIRPQVEDHPAPGQRAGDIDNRTVGGTLRRHTAQRLGAGTASGAGTRRQTGALPWTRQRGGGIGVAVFAIGHRLIGRRSADGARVVAESSRSSATSAAISAATTARIAMCQRTFRVKLGLN